MKSDPTIDELARRRQTFIRQQILRAKRRHSPDREVGLRKWSSVIFWVVFLGILATTNVQAELIWLGLFATFWGSLDIGCHWWRDNSAYSVGLGTLKCFGGLSVLSGAALLSTRSHPGFGICLLFTGGFVVFFSLLVRELRVGVILNQLVGFRSRRLLLELAFNAHRLWETLCHDWEYAKVHTQLFVLERIEAGRVRLESTKNRAKNEWTKKSSYQVGGQFARMARLLKSSRDLKTYP